MKDKTKIKIMIGAAVSLVVILLIVTLVKGNKKTPIDNEGLLLPSSTPSSSIEENIEFEEIKVEGDTMSSSSGYFQLDFFMQDAKDMSNIWKLKPMNGKDGTTVKFLTGNTKYLSEDGDEFIMSGYYPTLISRTDEEGNLPPYVREEKTGKRIKLFASNETKLAYETQWSEGQAILNGAKSEEGSVLIDGALTLNKFTRKGDELYINILDVAKHVVSTVSYSLLKGSIVIHPNEFVTVEIPTTDANYGLQNTFKVGSGLFTFKSWNGPSFARKVPVIDSSDMLVNVKDLNVMLGWRTYTNGTAIHIITDPVNVSNLTAVFSNGRASSVERIETLENGSRVVRIYNEDGVLISTEPYDESTRLDESPQQGANGSNTSNNMPNEDIGV